MSDIAKRTALSDVMFDALRDRIISGSLKSGEVLPGERQLSAQFEVNRGVVREAIKRLQQAGLVLVRPGGRTTVAEYLDSCSIELLPQLLTTNEGWNLPLLIEITELRNSSALTLVRVASEQASAKDMSLLSQRMQLLELASSPEAALKAHCNIWHGIAQVSNNTALRLLFNGIRSSYFAVAPLLGTVMRVELNDRQGLRKLLLSISDGASDDAQAAANEHLKHGLLALRGARAKNQLAASPQRLSAHSC